MSSTNHYIARPYTPGELAAQYGVSIRTFKTWTDMHKDRIGERRTRYFSTRQVKIIYECLGYPTELVEDD